MEHPSPREVAFDQTPELGPGHSSTLAHIATPKHVLAERVQGVNIARYGVVVEVALDHAPQPATNHWDLASSTSLFLSLKRPRRDLGSGKRPSSELRPPLRRPGQSGAAPMHVALSFN